MEGRKKGRNNSYPLEREENVQQEKRKEKTQEKETHH